MKKYLTLIFFLLFAYTSNAQQMAPGDIPTPNASSLGMYGNIPISYYTGRANISIPIFEMQATGFSNLFIYNMTQLVFWSTVYLVGLDIIGH